MNMTRTTADSGLVQLATQILRLPPWTTGLSRLSFPNRRGFSPFSAESADCVEQRVDGGSSAFTDNCLLRASSLAAGGLFRDSENFRHIERRSTDFPVAPVRKTLDHLCAMTSARRALVG